MVTLNAGMMCIKYILFILNFIFVLIGAVIISTGTALLLVFKDFDTFLESHYFKPAELLIGAGVIIFIVSFFGSVGAVKESTMLINLYGLFMFLVLILEICSGITAFVLRYVIVDDIKLNMMNALNEYTKTDYAKESWDFTQKNLHCCGVERPSDWEPLHVHGHVVIIQGLVFTVPNSCCHNLPSYCYYVYKKGCLNVLENHVSDFSLIIGYTALGVTIVQFLGIIIACLLVKAIRRAKTEQEMERQASNHRLFEPNTTGVSQEGRVVSVLHFPRCSSSDA